MLKSYGWGGVVAHGILVSAQGPLAKVLGLDNLKKKNSRHGQLFDEGM